MKRKRTILLLAFLLPLSLVFCITSKIKYTYYIKQNAPLDTTVVYPNAEYEYTILIKEQMYGSYPADFTVTLENGKFLDGSTSKICMANSILYVIWNDITFTESKISISEVVNNDTAYYVFQKGRSEISKPIGSLKGVTPNLIAGPEPLMGNKTQLTAEVLGDIVYPGIMISNGFGGQTNKKVETVEWSLPKNWKTNRNESGIFYRQITDNLITVTPDYVNNGAIKVRGVNELNSAYTDVAFVDFDRGFSFTDYPSSITFGDVTARNFSVTAIPGLIYEWKAPIDWHINGQGSTFEGLNINSVSITPSFCTYSNGIVQVRIKKDGEISEWDTVPYLGVLQPSIVQNTSTIYQYEVANFTLANINNSAIQSINWTGNGVSYIDTQGLN